jgi:hypothetical protein
MVTSFSPARLAYAAAESTASRTIAFVRDAAQNGQLERPTYITTTSSLLTSGASVRMPSVSGAMPFAWVARIRGMANPVHMPMNKIRALPETRKDMVSIYSFAVARAPAEFKS